MADTPDDWESPSWAHYEKVHCWRNYISDEIQGMWKTFTAAQKQALARQAEECAGREVWD